MQTVVTNSRNDNMFYRDIQVLTYKIEYPVFHSTCGQKASQSINEYYAVLAESKERYCRDVLYPQAADAARYIQKNNPPFNSYEFVMTYKITYNAGCITSLYMEEYTYMGGAHGSTVRTSDTWDFMTGKRMQLKDFFAEDHTFQEKIINQIENQIAERLKESPDTYFDDYAKRLRDTFSPNSFYLTPNGIVIYFQQYDIAPYAAGFPEFSI